MPLKSYSNIKAQEAAGKVFLDFFVYVAEVIDLAPGASQTDIVNVQADSDFILDKMAVSADIAGAGQTEATRVIPLATLLINDTGSGRNLQSDPMDINSVAGNGQLPFVLTQPRVFTANSSIQFTFTNFDAADTYANLRLALIGRKVFQY